MSRTFFPERWADRIFTSKGWCKSLTESVFSDLTPWQLAQLARYPKHLYTQDYIDALCTEFSELHGDRAFADDPAIVVGNAHFEDTPVVVIGHQKDFPERTQEL